MENPLCLAVMGSAAFSVTAVCDAKDL
jgi:hypothetical protein